MPFPHLHSNRLPTSIRNQNLVPKLCPKIIKNIKTYLKISNSIEILEPLKIGLFNSNFIIFYTLAFSAASLTQVKSEVQVLYRPPALSSARCYIALNKFRIDILSQPRRDQNAPFSCCQRPKSDDQDNAAVIEEKGFIYIFCLTNPSELCILCMLSR